MQSRTITTSDPFWMELLNRNRHDFYHVPMYLELEAQRMGGSALGVLCHDENRIAFFPLILRELPVALQGVAPGIRDATSPYGYPTPLYSTNASSDVAFVTAGFREFVRVMRSMSVVTSFLRLHPLLPFETVSCEEDGIITVEHGPTVWVDLRKTKEVLHKEMGATHRNLVLRAKREGFTVYEDVEQKGLRVFSRLYRDTMLRRNADERYLFDDRYFEQLAKALGPLFHLWMVEKDGMVTAAGIFTVCDGLVQYHLSGSDGRYQKLSPTRLMIAEVRDWAVRNGNHSFHLGGGLGSRDDGLFRFKKGFSNDTAIFRTMQIVAMPECLKTLNDRWQELAGWERSKAQNYFPPYRQSYE